MANPAVCRFVSLSVYYISILRIRVGQLIRFQFHCQLWSIMILASPDHKNRVNGIFIMPHVMMCRWVFHFGTCVYIHRHIYIHTYICVYVCLYICPPKRRLMFPSRGVGEGLTWNTLFLIKYSNTIKHLNVMFSDQSIIVFSIWDFSIIKITVIRILAIIVQPYLECT